MLEIGSLVDGKYKILFVCLGNICRSPSAQAVMQHLIDERGQSDKYYLDSAGTYGGHAGSLPDPRMRQHAKLRGYDLTHRSRKVTGNDFEDFDLSFAGTICVSLSNGTVTYVSRRYVAKIKQLLGI